LSSIDKPVKSPFTLLKTSGAKLRFSSLGNIRDNLKPPLSIPVLSIGIEAAIALEAGVVPVLPPVVLGTCAIGSERGIPADLNLLATSVSS
jgi:hypothetical protein